MHQPLQTDKTAERLARFNSRLQQSAGSSLLVHTREQWQLRDGLALEDSISGLAAITCSAKDHEYAALRALPPRDPGYVCEPLGSPRNGVEQATDAGRSGGIWRIPGVRLPAIRVSE
jgi:hypothetical protein